MSITTELAATKARGMLKGWKPWEIGWMATATAVILAVSLLGGDTPIGLISAIAGVITVVMAAKGKIATFYFGIVQASTYAYIAYSHNLLGEAMLNAFFFLPFQIIGIIMWKRNAAESADLGQDVIGKRLNLKQWILLGASVAIAAFGYSILLNSMGAAQAGLDSYAVVLSVFAQILMTLRYREQWMLWIIINVLTITLWVRAHFADPETNNFAILAMWIAFLANSIYGYINWTKMAKEAEAAKIAEGV